jgi:hypothetical protein
MPGVKGRSGPPVRGVTSYGSQLTARAEIIECKFSQDRRRSCFAPAWSSTSTQPKSPSEVIFSGEGLGTGMVKT